MSLLLDHKPEFKLCTFVADVGDLCKHEKTPLTSFQLCANGNTWRGWYEAALMSPV